MKYYVLDTNLDIVDGIELFTSMIWSERYYTSGEFELYLPATKESMQFYKKAAQEHYYIIPAQEKTSDLHSIPAMIIERSKLDLQFDAMDHIIVTGKSLKHILNRRVLLGSTNISGNLEEAIQDIVYKNAIAPKEEGRAIPRLILGKNYIGDHGETITDTINTQASGGYLDEAIESICKLYKVGWDVRIDFVTKRLIFFLYKGTDRSYNQTANETYGKYSYVAFADKFDNLLKSTFDANTEKYRNIAYIDAEYTDIDHTTKEQQIKTYGIFVRTKKYGINTELNERGFSGLNRHEFYLSGSNLVSSSKDQTTGDTNVNVLDNLMRSSAEKTLENYTASIEVSSDVVPNLTFGINEDYYLGDVVSVRNSYDINMTSRITEVIQTWTTAEHSIIPTFEVEDFDGKDEEKKPLDVTRVRVIAEGEDGSGNVIHGTERITKSGEFRKKFLHNGMIYSERSTNDENSQNEDREVITSDGSRVPRRCTISFVDMDKEGGTTNGSNYQ